MKWGIWNQATEKNERTTKKMSEKMSDGIMKNTVFSTQNPATTIKYPMDFFGHQQANTLSDINITREDIIDLIKTISQNFSRGLDDF